MLQASCQEPLMPLKSCLDFSSVGLGTELMFLDPVVSCSSVIRTCLTPRVLCRKAPSRCVAVHQNWWTQQTLPAPEAQSVSCNTEVRWVRDQSGITAGQLRTRHSLLQPVTKTENPESPYQRHNHISNSWTVDMHILTHRHTHTHAHTRTHTHTHTHTHTSQAESPPHKAEAEKLDEC